MGSHRRPHVGALVALAFAAATFAAEVRAAPSAPAPKVTPPTPSGASAVTVTTGKPMTNVDPLAAFASTDQWHQIFMAPRVTGNLRAVAVDPNDTNSLYVGTEEGTVAHSGDGGVTWEEIELTPFTMESPAFRTSIYGPVRKYVDVFAGFKVQVGDSYYDFNPLNQRSADVALPTIASPHERLGLPPWFVFPFSSWPYFDLDTLLLSTTGTSDPKPFEPVRQLAICPGGANTIYVTTGQRLFVSADGTSYVPQYGVRDSDRISAVSCSPSNANTVIMLTNDATLISKDSGASFDPIPGALGAIGAAAVAWGPGGSASLLYIASGRDLWIGDPLQADGLKPVSVTGEFTAIRSVAVTAQSIWLATDTGVRSSKDGGTTWTSVDDLEGFDWDMVAVDTAANTQEHVAVLRKDIAFDSIDGVVFRPFFRGQSRRSLYQVAAMPTKTATGFAILSSGELWTTNTLDPATVDKNDDVRRYAVRRLRQLPSLSETLERARVKLRISDAQIEENFSRLKTSFFLPSLVVGGNFELNKTAKATGATISTPTNLVARNAFTTYNGGIELVWELPGTIYPRNNSRYQIETARANIHKVRTRFLYAIEDAYQERRQLLAQLAVGGLDTEQIFSLQARIEVLDVVLQVLSNEKTQR